MDIKKSIFMLLKDMKKSEPPITEIRQIETGMNHFGITTPGDNQLLLKIAKHHSLKELSLLEMGELESNIHEIYEKFADSWEYGKILEHHDFDIDWLSDLLDTENYNKLEKYLLYYCSRNDEVLFHVGFKYAWGLFMEWAQNKIPEKSKKAKSDPASPKEPFS